MEYGNYARQWQRQRSAGTDAGRGREAEAHRTFIRITQADKRREGRNDEQWNGCAVEAAGNQLSKKGQQNANVNDR